MKRLFFLLTLIGACGDARACNTCGCAASNQYLGILPQLSGHFIGLQYSYRWYESHHDASEPDKAAGREYYQAAQLWGRYSLGKRVQLFAFVPYQYNTKQEGDARSTLSGIGDVSALVNVQLLRPSSTCGAWQHWLQAGGGVKAPTGAYDNAVLGSGDVLAPSMQAGTGSWDYIGNTNYTLQHGLWGLNAEAAYTLTTPNHQTYKYGNRISGAAQVFRQYTRKGLRLLPAAGLRYENAGQDYDNYPTRSLAQYTGGYMMYATAALRAYSRHWGAELGYSQPIAQDYGDGLVKSKGKAEAGVVYLF